MGSKSRRGKSAFKLSVVLTYSWILVASFISVLSLVSGDSSEIRRMMTSKAKVSSNGRRSLNKSLYDSSTDTLMHYQYEGKFVQELVEVENLTGILDLSCESREQEALSAPFVVKIHIMGNSTIFDATMSKYIFPGAILLIPKEFNCSTSAAGGDESESVTYRIIDISNVNRVNNSSTNVIVRTVPATFAECFEDAALEFFRGPPPALKKSRKLYWKGKENDTHPDRQVMSTSKGDIDA